jgi:class 3 adenylate cyclase
MGIHTGEAELRDGDYYGGTLNRASRIMAVGHGGQILISETTRQIAQEHFPASISVIDLGKHQLKGLSKTEKIFQISMPDLQQESTQITNISNEQPSYGTYIIYWSRA